MKQVCVSVPGSLMLFGEHAVLHGKLSLVTAIDKRVTVKLSPRRDDKIILHNVSFPEYAPFSSVLSKLSDEIVLKLPHWRFVLSSIVAQKARLQCGFDLKIKSDFASHLGLGSSAAVSAAVLGALSYWLNNKKPVPLELFKETRNVIIKVQGVGSGADAAASIFGGIIAYQMRLPSIERINIKIPLTVVYSGYKTTTKEVIEKVSASVSKHHKVYARLFEVMDECSNAAKKALQVKDWQKLGELMNIHQGLQDALGVNNEALSELIFLLRKDKNILGAKISGAGLGDSVIGLGKVKRGFIKNISNVKAQMIDVNTTSDGILYF